MSLLKCWFSWVHGKWPHPSSHCNYTTSCDFHPFQHPPSQQDQSVGVESRCAFLQVAISSAGWHRVLMLLLPVSSENPVVLFYTVFSLIYWARFCNAAVIEELLIFHWYHLNNTFLDVFASHFFGCSMFACQDRVRCIVWIHFHGNEYCAPSYEEGEAGRGEGEQGQNGKLSLME